MPSYRILAWQPLLRPPLPSDMLPEDADALDVPIKALTCRNQVTSVLVLVTSPEPVKGARLVVGDLSAGHKAIPSSAVRTRLVGSVPTPEAGVVMDPIYDVEEFEIDQSATLHIDISIPKGAMPGIYVGPVSLLINGREKARGMIELEIANVELPDVHDSGFFLNVWMNPACVARWHEVEMWSDKHFELMRPYVEDLACHGQKTAVVPISYRPWGTQTRDPFPNAIIATRRGDNYEFDFSIFDRFVEFHEDCGIDRAIHCYSIVSGPGATGASNIEYTDLDTGETKILETLIGDDDYVAYWSAFLAAFEQHLKSKGWLEKTYLAFDEKPPDVMEKLYTFLYKYGKGFKLSLADNSRSENALCLDDVSLHVKFDEHGIEDQVPTERATMGVLAMLQPELGISEKTSDKNCITTYYVCCGPLFPNTFLFSPLVESRMLPFLAAQGGYDGFLRWSYNDWTDDPFTSPEWSTWPTGDIFFVYPGDKGPVSSLRWEQLREGIYDYELAMLLVVQRSKVP